MKTRLKELRVEKGYTQQEVANAIMCAASTYAHYEKDERRIDSDTLIHFSKLFKVSIDYILYNDMGGEIND